MCTLVRPDMNFVLDIIGIIWGPLKPPGTVFPWCIPRGFRGALNWAPTMPRRASLSVR